MTGPRVETQTPPLSRILSPEEFEAAQSLPTTSALRGTSGTTGISRILSPEEFDAAQQMTGPSFRQWTIPVIPRDATRTKGSPDQPYQPELAAMMGSAAAERSAADYGKGDTGLRGIFKRQLVAPVLSHPGQAALVTAATATPLGPIVGAVIGADMATNIATYGYQKYLEQHASPAVRREMEADPDRTQGEAAATQAAMFGLGALVHVGVKTYRNLDVSHGMMEGSARAASEQATPRFNPGFADAHKNADFAARLAGAGEATDANQRFGVQSPPQKGLETFPSSRAGSGAVPVEGIIAPETPKAGKVAPVGAIDPATQLADRAALDNSVIDYARQRREQDLADLRAGDAERVNMAPRRRPRGEKAPFFETEQGAQTLGATAARHGVADDANPYHPASSLASAWQEGHGAATESFPEGFSMGGALTDNRIPSDYAVPRVPGFEPHWQMPDTVTPETVSLADALKPSRFRAHSNDELVNAAIDGQARVEQAQAAVEHARLRGLVGEAARDDMENRGVSIADEAESSSKAADRELARATSQMQQIERELAIRGVTGDDLAEQVKAAKEQRAEREGMQQEETLAAHMGEDDPFAEQSRRTGLSTVEGTGDLKTRGLARGVEEKAIANRLNLGTTNLPGYRSVNMSEQASRAAQLLAEHPDLARQIAFGEADPPADLLPESVFVAVENRAIAEGDVGTLRELATSHRTSEATTMGQRIRTLAERDPDSPVGAIKKVIDVRMGGAGKVAQATDEVVASIRKQLAKSSISREQWAEFVDSLRC